MKIERLKNNRKILLGTVIVFVVILTLIITTSLAKYKVTESINIATGIINYIPSDLSIMGIYIESDSGYTQSDTIPESGYELNETESYCKQGDTKLDVTISYDMNSKELQITPMTQKGTKCYLYFDVYTLSAKEFILANVTTITTRDSFGSALTTATTGTIYSAEDDDGTSYYYAGAPTDNWIKFAGMYWRIIRINGDETIRLIYHGDAQDDDGTVLEPENYGASIGSNSYNVSGIKYSYSGLHGTTYKSQLLESNLEPWYTNNLASYEDYIDINAGFCDDRTTYSGTGSADTYYAGYGRLYYNLSHSSPLPSLKCFESSDLFTISSSSKGNKALDYPIGLITADEVAYAGGVYDITGGTSNYNKSFYLYNGSYYWTITPCSLTDSVGSAPFMVDANGLLSGAVGISNIRPVINIRADVILTGSGTSTDPYVVS